MLRPPKGLEELLNSKHEMIKPNTPLSEEFEKNSNCASRQQCSFLYLAYIFDDPWSISNYNLTCPFLRYQCTVLEIKLDFGLL